VHHEFSSDRPLLQWQRKYKPILNDSAPVNSSETDKAIDFKCGTQLQTYNTHKVTNFPKEEAWPKCSICRLPINDHDENVGQKSSKDVRNFARLSAGYVENPPKRSPHRVPQYPLGQLSLRLKHATSYKIR